MTGYLDERQVVLTCEVHGFLPSTNPPIWRLRESCTLSSSLSKFFIMTGTTTQPSVLISNVTRVSGLRSTLTIRQLSTKDEGSYSCVADGASSLVQLSVEVSRTPSDSPCEYEHEYIIQITNLDGSTFLHANNEMYTAVHVYSVLM